jgi:hypothetical protein
MACGIAPRLFGPTAGALWASRMASVSGDSTIEPVAIDKATSTVSLRPNTAAIKGSPAAA